jgi:hypothetical protein
MKNDENAYERIEILKGSEAQTSGSIRFVVRNGMHRDDSKDPGKDHRCTKRFEIQKGSKTRERFTEIQKDQVDYEKIKEDEDKKPKFLKIVDPFYYHAKQSYPKPCQTLSNRSNLNQ